MLPNGTTAHKLYNLPIDLSDDTAICWLNKKQKEILFSADVLIWDEASMIPKIALEMVDRTLRDLMKLDIVFGGKTIILGGDFRQISPVLNRAGKNQIINNTIKQSNLWSHFNIQGV